VTGGFGVTGVTGKGGGGTLNLEAYDQFLKGIYFHSKDFLSAEKAMAAFQKAVVLDANYGEAHALIAEMYIVYAGYGLMPPVEAYAKARAAAQKAITINEREPRAHKALAYVYFTSDWNWETAVLSYNKAVEYGLRVPDQFMTYYDVFVKKDYDQAVSASEQMAAIDPLNIESHWHLGLINFFSGRFEDAMESFNTTLELDPSYSEGHHWKGAILGYMGKYDEAIKSLEKALEITHGQGPANLDLLIVKIQMGNKEEVLKTLSDWENSEEHINPMDPAMLYALLNMPDKAIYWLEKSYRERAIMTVSLNFYWIWDPIREDPRFIEIYKRMNFPD
jgi:tetratricopeptide (TPR) repeat protein